MANILSPMSSVPSVWASQTGHDMSLDQAAVSKLALKNIYIIWQV